MSGLFFLDIDVHDSAVVSREVRIALYCGILAFAWQDLISLGEAWEGTAIIFPYVPLLAIPAIQARSGMLALRALLLGPALVLIHTLAGTFFALDNRISTSVALFVPGGWNSADPGGPPEVLMIHLALFLLLSGAALIPYYRRTKVLGIGYVARLLGGGFLLEAVLSYEIQYTTLGWGEELTISDTTSRLQWIISTTTWLLACGLFSAFVFGVKPATPLPRKDAA